MKLFETNMIASLLLLSTVTIPVFAQSSLIGKYSGNQEIASNAQDSSGGVVVRGVTLDIQKIEDGKVTGTALLNQQGGACPGTHLFTGTVKESRVVLRIRKSGATGECSMTFNLVAEGDKLIGTHGAAKRRVEVSK